MGMTLSYAELENLHKAETEEVSSIIVSKGAGFLKKDKNCFQTEASIQTRTKGFNPTRWSAILQDRGGQFGLSLDNKDIRVFQEIFRRVGVSSIQLDSLTYMSQAVLTLSFCLAENDDEQLEGTILFVKNKNTEK